MASFKSYPIFYSALGLFAVAALAAGWGIYDRGAVAKKSTAQLTQKRNELRSLVSSNPAPGETSKAAVEADLARTEVALGEMRKELRGVGPVAEAMRNAPVPTEPTDVFFNLETFVESMRRQAQAAEVKIKADERFGFATYSASGPDRDLIPQVFRQRQVSEYLLNALFDARPRELLSLQRERPQARTQSGRASTSVQQGSNNQGNQDLFEIDRRISARVPGFVDAVAFRISFIGETNSLRSLLNKLSSFELPLVVRSVEVEAVPSAAPSAAPAPQANSLASIFGAVAAPVAAEPPKPKPLVEKVLSRFTVTVELIDLVEAPATEATPIN